MIHFKATILKFDAKGEKTGWTYIEIPEKLAAELMPGNKKSFRVKGTLDSHAIKQTALIPMGGGSFILPLNAEIRKHIGKRKGHILNVSLEADNEPVAFSAELMLCFEDAPEALKQFNTLPKSHQNYYSKWIESAKTNETKSKRIAQTINAMLQKQTYAEMIRAGKASRNDK